MPTSTMAERRLMRQQGLAQLAQVVALREDANRQLQQSELALQQGLQEFNKADLTERGKLNIKQEVVEPLRAQIKKEIEEYGDYEKWLTQRGDYWKSYAPNQIMGSNAFNRELQNTQYIKQGLKDKSEGKQLVGDFDTMVTDYIAGKTNTISYSGAYKPVNVQEYFAKTESPLYGPWGIPSGKGFKSHKPSDDEVKAVVYGELGQIAGDDFLKKNPNLLGPNSPLYYKRDVPSPIQTARLAMDQATLPYRIESMKANIAQSYASAENMRTNSEAKKAEINSPKFSVVDMVWKSNVGTPQKVGNIPGEAIVTDVSTHMANNNFSEMLTKNARMVYVRNPDTGVNEYVVGANTPVLTAAGSVGVLKPPKGSNTITVTPTNRIVKFPVESVRKFPGAKQGPDAGYQAFVEVQATTNDAGGLADRKFYIPINYTEDVGRAFVRGYPLSLTKRGEAEVALGAGGAAPAAPAPQQPAAPAVANYDEY